MFGGGMWGSPPQTGQSPMHYLHAADHPVPSPFQLSHARASGGEGSHMQWAGKAEPASWDGAINHGEAMLLQSRAVQQTAQMLGVDMSSEQLYMSWTQKQQQQQQQHGYLGQPQQPQFGYQHGQQAAQYDDSTPRMVPHMFNTQQRQPGYTQQYEQQQLAFQPPRSPLYAGGGGYGGGEESLKMMSPKAHSTSPTREGQQLQQSNAAAGMQPMSTLGFAMQSQQPGALEMSFGFLLEEGAGEEAPAEWSLPPLPHCDDGGVQSVPTSGSLGSSWSYSTSTSSMAIPIGGSCGSTPTSVHLSPQSLSAAELPAGISLSADDLAIDLDLPRFLAVLDDDDADFSDELGQAPIPSLASPKPNLAPLNSSYFEGSRADRLSPSPGLESLSRSPMMVGSAGASPVYRPASRGMMPISPVGSPFMIAASGLHSFMMPKLALVATVSSVAEERAEGMMGGGAEEVPGADLALPSEESEGEVDSGSPPMGSPLGDDLRSPGGVGDSGCTVKLRGLPYRASMQDIRTFFEKLKIAPNGIRILMNGQGRPSGEATVHFGSTQVAQRALKKDRQYMGGRYIEVFSFSATSPPTTPTSQPLSSPALPSPMRGASRRSSSPGALLQVPVLQLPQAQPQLQPQQQSQPQQQPQPQQPPQQQPTQQPQPQPCGVSRPLSAQAPASALAAATGARSAAVAVAFGRQAPGSKAGPVTAGARAVAASEKQAEVEKSRSSSDAGSGQRWESAPSRSNHSETGGDHIVRMRGLPFKASPSEIAKFFHAVGVEVKEGWVHIGINAQGRPTGEANVHFRTAEAAHKAMAKDHHSMGSRYIELFDVGRNAKGAR
mmetsp:Transcript_14150/g.32979  ORF Transcript_14150/g.32979 Transcript_14150/m.32979 type:complete len:831 (-) Transcript_14150:390-2882(-)